VLLLDEPTSALDASLQDDVAQLLVERRDLGTTMIGIMHDSELLAQLSNVTVHMERGRVTGIDGTVADALQVRVA
jgi:peptide/nickel transport system ATP-binding protein